ncbi:MAG TPA: putative peptidoglycan glycosyltransferase FtsW, partial [Caldilineaceae bacterium]|nr:putative peptidoglycan glycosyltransferase FtsW [Caldilineaceae bacterium]
MTATKSQPAKSHADQGGYDWGMLTIVATLLALGTVMVFSASYAQGIEGYGNPLYFFVQQLIWVAVGIVVMVVAMHIPYQVWERWSIPMMAAALLALAAVIVVGGETYGATRTFFSGRVQPSEPAKIIIIIYVSAWLASKGSRIRNVQVGLLPFSVLMGIITVLIVAQPNISTSILIVATASIMFFIAGAELRQLLIVGLGGTATFWLIIKYSAYAGGRVERYLENIWDPLQSSEWQTTRTIRALLNGGVFGQGLGNGDYKLPGGVPLPWSDNIFAVIGEELGLLGALFVILLFSLLAYRGLRTALRAPDTFGMLLATGITSLLTLQAIINTAVVTAVAPATGVTLPFITYGGSSLVTVMGAIGILLNISRGESRAPATSTDLRTAYARLDFGWRNRRSRLSSPGGSSGANP